MQSLDNPIAYQEPTPVTREPRAPRRASTPPELPPEARRVHPRVAIETPVGPGTSAQLYGGLAMNVSQGGVYIKTRTTLKMGDRFTLDLRLGKNYKLAVDGIARWIEKDDAGTTVGVGLQFIDLTDDQEYALQNWVNDNLDEVMQR